MRNLTDNNLSISEIQEDKLDISEEVITEGVVSEVAEQVSVEPVSTHGQRVETFAPDLDLFGIAEPDTKPQANLQPIPAPQKAVRNVNNLDSEFLDTKREKEDAVQELLKDLEEEDKKRPTHVKQKRSVTFNLDAPQESPAGKSSDETATSPNQTFSSTKQAPIQIDDMISQAFM